MSRRRWAISIVSGIALGLAVLMIAGGSRALLAQQDAATPTQALVSTPQPTPTIPAYTVVFLRQPGPDIPTLQEMIGDAADDEAAKTRIAAYFDANAARLAELWREDNPERLKALFTMVLAHISLPYGATEFPTGLVDFSTQEYAHCGTYTFAQIHMADALGLTYRVIEFVGEHAWLEALIDGEWEVFDATTDTWLSGGVEEMLAGAPREYAHYYTPLLDIDHPEAREHIPLGYNMQRLRARMPLLGVSYLPPGEMLIGGAVTPPA